MIVLSIHDAFPTLSHTLTYSLVPTYAYTPPNTFFICACQPSLCCDVRFSRIKEGKLYISAVVASFRTFYNFLSIFEAIEKEVYVSRITLQRVKQTNK